MAIEIRNAVGGVGGREGGGVRADCDRGGRQVELTAWQPAPAIVDVSGSRICVLLGKVECTIVAFRRASSSSRAPVNAIHRGRAGRVKTAQRRSAAEGSLDAPKRSRKIVNRSDRAHAASVDSEQPPCDRARMLVFERRDGRFGELECDALERLVAVGDEARAGHEREVRQRPNQAAASRSVEE
jgi:hypothetical protein